MSFDLFSLDLQRPSRNPYRTSSIMGNQYSPQSITQVVRDTISNDARITSESTEDISRRGVSELDFLTKDVLVALVPVETVKRTPVRNHRQRSFQRSAASSTDIQPSKSEDKGRKERERDEPDSGNDPLTRGLHKDSSHSIGSGSDGKSAAENRSRYREGHSPEGVL